MALHGYQKDLKRKAISALRKKGKVVMQLPTGGGKTVIAADIIRTTPGPVWFVCHRREIIRQASQHLDAAGIRHGRIAAGEPETKARVQVASIGSLPRRIDRHAAPALIIWDECHHAAAKSWRAVKDKFPKARHLGMTATPERLDGKGLSELFKELVTGPSIRELISQGRLSKFRYFAPSEPDLAAARIQAGDYARSDLGKIMDRPVLIGSAIDEYQKHVPGKRALAFCVSIEASKSLVAKFNEAGIAAAHVDGATPPDERDAAVRQLEAGKIKVLSNVEVFTEGFDLPAIDAVILMRPTKSLALYLQMVGRGLRKARGKGVATIFDHAGLHADHGLPDAEWQWSLEGGARRARLAQARANGERHRKCPECKAVHSIAPECPECGFEYPSGREVGEFDGELAPITERKTLPPARSVVPDGAVVWSKFFRSFDFRRSEIIRMERSGLPTYRRPGHSKNSFRFVIPREALHWIETVWPLVDKASNYHPPRGEPKDQWLSGQRFCLLFSPNLKRAQVKLKILKDRGLPTHEENGWVHIQRGLEWVRDNTSFKIPDSAWPDKPKRKRAAAAGELHP